MASSVALGAALGHYPWYGTQPVLKISNISRPGLKPADLQLADGECVALAGPSGSGKTLLLRAIADLDPNTGDVSLDGENRDAMPAPRWRRRVVYVPAEAGWWSERVIDHFPEPDIARPLLSRMGLPAAALDWEVQRLSTGEKQRLALSRALLTSPGVLLLDEPTSGLDPDATALVESILHEKAASGAGIVMVTHDAKQASRMADRRFKMADGMLSAEDGGQGGRAP